MKSYEKLTPEGTRDFLFEESDALRRIERGLSELFKEKGYKKVITPTVEFFDVFNRESAGTLPENLYSMTDAYGRLLVLRPDSTLPIARIAATRLKGAELPIRLYYNQNVFSRRKKLTGRNDETSQSGIELIGVNGIRADIEVIETAIEALKVCGAPDYKIEIGHAGFFKALCDELSAPQEVKNDINEYMEQKNFVALNSVLDTLGGDRVAETIRNLPRMFGGSEVIEKAMTLCKSDKAQSSLNYLDKLYKKLGGASGGDNLIIDLSLVHRSNYYTGIVFRGYTEGSGAPVLQGGRYDAQNIIVDPVMVATSGSRLMESPAVAVMKKELLPISTLVTPNIPEAAVLSGMEIKDKDDMEKAAAKIHSECGCAVLLKGGHSIEDASDLLYNENESFWFYGKRIANPNTHGTGCTLSSAIAANLAKGYDLKASVKLAKDYISEALAFMLDLGKGNGPMNHAFMLSGKYAAKSIGE